MVNKRYHNLIQNKLREPAYPIATIKYALDENGLSHYSYSSLLNHVKSNGLGITQHQIGLKINENPHILLVRKSKLNQLIDGLNIPISLEQLVNTIESDEQ